MTKPNRLVVLLDSLLNGGGPGSVHLSRFHYDRLVRSVSGEPPGRLRRRVLLEQAAYALTHGARVTDVAFATGYESAEGFSRAFSRAFACPPRDFSARQASAGRGRPTGIAGLKRRWDKAKTQYGGQVRRIASEGAWETTFIDAECDPPQTFTYGGAIAHVLTFSAHRRTLALGALHDAGITDLGSGDPMRFERSARPSQP